MDRIELEYLFLHHELKEHRLQALGYLSQLFLFALCVSLPVLSSYLLPEQDDKNINNIFQGDVCFLRQKVPATLDSPFEFNLVGGTHLRLFEGRLQDIYVVLFFGLCDSSLNSSLCTVPHSSTKHSFSPPASMSL